MKQFACKLTSLVAVAFAVAVVQKGFAMEAYDFEQAWKDVAEAQRKGLPRTVTNKLEEIGREAAVAARWPEAARAFLVRENAMSQFRDEQPQDWLPAFAASVDAQPAPLQAVLQLHLAHTYNENSRRWRWGGAAPTKLDDEAAKDKMPPWSPEKINSTLEAQFAKVFERSDELKGMKLADWTDVFEKGFVPESYCPTLYDFAVRDAIAFYGRTIPDKTLEKGLALYNRLVAFHRDDGNVDALAMAELNAAEYVKSFDNLPEKARESAFATFLDGFIKRHEGKTDVVAIAAAKKAELLKDSDLFAAHGLASAYAAKWPESIGGKMCANIVSDIEEKSIAVNVERNWCAPWPEIEVEARNVTEVHFRLVPVSFDDLADDASMGSAQYGHADDVLRDKHLKRKPAKEWMEKLPLKPDYTAQKFRFQVPSDMKNGHYALYAAANGKFGSDELPVFAQYITVTPLALVLVTGNGDFKGTVYRAESGEPVPGAKVELWASNTGRHAKLREKYVTDKDGNFVADVSKKDAGYNALLRHVRVVKDGCEVLSLGCEGSGCRDYEAPKYEHMDIFTDRSLYRPGQEILVKGIAYHANPHTKDFHTLPGEIVLVVLTDPNGKEVAAKRLRTNKWGSFVYKFTAPTDRLTGGYTVMARVVLKDGVSGESKKTVNVEEYKRPKFSASFDDAPENAVLGSPVTLSGKALTYSGLPVQHAKVKWNVERTTRYPEWWSLFGGKSDDDGEGYVGEGMAETERDALGSGGIRDRYRCVACKRMVGGPVAGCDEADICERFAQVAFWRAAAGQGEAQGLSASGAGEARKEACRNRTLRQWRQREGSVGLEDMEGGRRAAVHRHRRRHGGREVDGRA